MTQTVPDLFHIYGLETDLVVLTVVGLVNVLYINGLFVIAYLKEEEKKHMNRYTR